MCGIRSATIPPLKHVFGNVFKCEVSVRLPALPVADMRHGAIEKVHSIVLPQVELNIVVISEADYGHASLVLRFADVELQTDVTHERELTFPVRCPNAA